MGDIWHHLAGAWVAEPQAQLFLTGWGNDARWTEVWDVDGLLEPVAERLDWQVRPAELLDGRPILLGSRSTPQGTRLATLDPETFEIIQDRLNSPLICPGVWVILATGASEIMDRSL